MTQTMRRALSLSACLLALAIPSGTAQARPQAQDAGVRLADNPLLLPSVGVLVRIPENATASTLTAAGERTSAVILPSRPEHRWKMVIKSHKSANDELSNTEALDSVVRQILLSKPVHNANDGGVVPQDILDRNFKYSRITVESREQNLAVNNVPAERVYLTAPSLPEYPDAGITILNPAPGEFLLLHLECPNGTLDRHKQLFETVCDTVAFRDKSSLNAERAAAVLATNQLFESLNAADLESLLDDEPRFYRLYNPGKSGRPIDDEDVAWQRISISKGQAGELNPTKPRTQWSAAEREFGFVMHIDARAIWQDTVVDSQGVFFLSRDRSQESWSLRNTVRRDGASQTTTQTLVRLGRKLNYVVERPSEPRYAGEFLIPERGYLSKIESALFPRVIATRDIPGEFAYYAFDPGLDTIVLRYETFSPDGTGNWASTAKHVENALPSSIVYDEDGLITQRTSADGQKMEPISPEALRKLWGAKQIPSGR